VGSDGPPGNRGDRETASGAENKGSRFLFIFGCCALSLAQTMGPNSLYWTAAAAGLSLAWVGTGLYRFTRGAKARRAELEKQRELEIRSQRIRELEKELGLEPLELAAYDPPEMWAKGQRGDQAMRRARRGE
jgi:hypothetical protein